MTSTRIKTAIKFIIGVILLLLISTLLFSLFTIKQVKQNLKIQVDTRTTIIALKDNFTYMLNAETGQRGYIITSDTNYLHQYHNALEKIGTSRSELRALMKNKPASLKNLDTLEKRIDLKLARLAKIILLKEKGDEKTIDEMLTAPEGKYLMDNIRSFNQYMQDEEERQFEERRIATNQSIESARYVFLIEGFFSLVITIFLAIVIIMELNRRTRTEQRIIRYNRELERKNKEIEQFAYIASHDLQEPLRSITNFSNLLIDKLQAEGNKETKEYARYITGSAKRMSDLIFDLLEYSRIGKDLNRSTIDCNELVKEILVDMAATIKETGAEIHVGKLPVVNGYIYLKSLFQNLMSNAIKFVDPDKHPIVTISATDLGKEYLFTVTDNGIGIEEIYYERIFIIFQRLHNRTEFPGTGIGLSQCKKIVELHGGRIWVESTPGTGSTFNFTIPKG